MNWHLVTYADENFVEQQKYLHQIHKEGFVHHPFNRKQLESTKFYKDNKKILDQDKGAGWWLWKPYYILEVLKKSKFVNEEIDEVIMGQVLTAGAGQNPARQAAINAGIPISKPAHIINQVCGSGLRAVISGYQSIKLGDSLNVIAGGQENMSITPHSIFYREEKKRYSPYSPYSPYFAYR